MAATQWLTFCYGLAIHRGIFQTREPQGPMRRVQAAAAIAVTLGGGVVLLKAFVH